MRKKSNIVENLSIARYRSSLYLAIDKKNKMGSYADDALFMSRNNIEYVELISDDGKSKVMVIPAWQGRVMTTSAAGDEGDSYGWINYSFIKKDK